MLTIILTDRQARALRRALPIVAQLDADDFVTCISEDGKTETLGLAGCAVLAGLLPQLTQARRKEAK